MEDQAKGLEMEWIELNRKEWFVNKKIFGNTKQNMGAMMELIE